MLVWGEKLRIIFIALEPVGWVLVRFLRKIVKRILSRNYCYLRSLYHENKILEEQLGDLVFREARRKR